MKKTLIIISSVLLVAMVAAGLIYYLDQEKEPIANTNASEQSNTQEASSNDVRQKIWDKLPSEQKERVDGDWQSGTVSKITLSKDSASWLKDESLAGEEVYMIDFPTKNTGVPNNMLICADIDTYEYLGNLPVD